jgi:hypothetical protein
MLELANQFGHTLDRRQRGLRRARQRKENDFLRKHTTTLTNLLQQAQKQFLLTDQSENVPKYAAPLRLERHPPLTALRPLARYAHLTMPALCLSTCSVALHHHAAVHRSLGIPR